MEREYSRVVDKVETSEEVRKVVEDEILPKLGVKASTFTCAEEFNSANKATAEMWQVPNFMTMG